MIRIHLDFNLQCTGKIGYNWLDCLGSFLLFDSHEKGWSNSEECGTKVINLFRVKKCK